MKKTKNKEKIQFLPGLGEKPRHYKHLSKYLKVLDVDWNTGQIKPAIRRADIITGFSMGAVLVCEYATKHKVKTLILCSLTPGAETLKRVQAEEVIFLVGEKEKWVLKEVKRVRKTLKCRNSIVVITGADHKITGKYKSRLIEIINK